MRTDNRVGGDRKTLSVVSSLSHGEEIRTNLTNCCSQGERPPSWTCCPGRAHHAMHSHEHIGLTEEVSDAFSFSKEVAKTKGLETQNPANYR